GGLLHEGQGKWYPGEPLPRWALGVFWRADGVPVWRDETLLADTAQAGKHTLDDARRVIDALVDAMQLPRARVITAYEPSGNDTPIGFVLPLRAAPRESSSGNEPRWETCEWPLANDRLRAVAGESPLGLRLPLGSLPRDVPIRTALTAQARDGHVAIFVPPIDALDDYLALIGALEATAAQLAVPLLIEGYPPPRDPRIRALLVTPDPGVIEVNVQPASSWRELVDTTCTLYDEARLAGLATEKFMLDGRHAGTGGGNHVTLGGTTPADSPLLRRPDLLPSLVTYWQNHPALSYLFSGQFVGPTS